MVENNTLEGYKEAISRNGLEETWKYILANNLVIEDITYSELYEMGLAIKNKKDKKQKGVYYTPEDVSKLLAKMFSELEGENICDVCCGTGNLVVEFLKQQGYERGRELCKQGKIYLYDFDSLSLEICKYRISELLGEDVIENIHIIEGDFLDKNILLPEDCKVISNPPYGKANNTNKNWNNTEILLKTQDLYSAIMEKIIKNSKSSVIITPFTFMHSGKFLPLRKFMNNYSGKIFVFDNVPGSIFKGKKHGTFNTNQSNSVRASITIVDNKGDKGFGVSPYIRFHNSEREKVLDVDFLTSLISNKKQIITNQNQKYCKTFEDVEGIFDIWKDKSEICFEDLLSKTKTEYPLFFPTTCRYKTVATFKDLKRDGKKVLYFKDRDTQALGYCLINSSFVYLFWRMYDGGITYPLTLLYTMPVLSLHYFDKQKLLDLVESIKRVESKYLVYKCNAGKSQENVKFPENILEKCNQFLVETIGIDYQKCVFDKIHRNHLFSEEGVL